jgi:hypothetical protein
MAMTPQHIVYERVREVHAFMTNGSKQRKEIVQFFSKKWTDDGYFTTASELSKFRTVDNYIRKVRQTFLNFENDVDIEKGRTLARLDDLYSKSVKIQDYKCALLILKQICEIVGLKSPTRISIVEEQPLFPEEDVLSNDSDK